MAKKPVTYRTAEVCRLLGLQPYVLKHWEEEFPVLAAGRTTAAQRNFSEAELGLIRRIKSLLYDEGYTVAGARKKLETEVSEHPSSHTRSLFDEVPGVTAETQGAAATETSGEERPVRRRSSRAAASAASSTQTPTDGGEAGDVGAAPTVESAATAGMQLDSAGSERVETLRRGIAEALNEARALLTDLERAPPR